MPSKRQVAKKINAQRCFECSLLTEEAVSEVFKTILRMTLQANRNLKKDSDQYWKKRKGLRKFPR